MATAKTTAKAAKTVAKKKRAPKSREAAPPAGNPQQMEGLVYDVQSLTAEEWAEVLRSVTDFISGVKAQDGIVAIAKIPRPKVGDGG